MSERSETQPGGAHIFVERRREPRMPCDGIPARVRIDENPEPAAAQIVDISTSGIRLKLNSSSEIGSNATVWFNDTVAAGEVRYCRRNPDGSFDVGLRLSDVLNNIC